MASDRGLVSGYDHGPGSVSELFHRCVGFGKCVYMGTSCALYSYSSPTSAAPDAGRKARWKAKVNGAAHVLREMLGP
jgi:hypothetical protein